MKRRPTGFVATCQCGVAIGAMDINRTERADAGRLLANGCTTVGPSNRASPAPGPRKSVRVSAPRQKETSMNKVQRYSVDG